MNSTDIQDGQGNTLPASKKQQQQQQQLPTPSPEPDRRDEIVDTTSQSNAASTQPQAEVQQSSSGPRETDVSPAVSPEAPAPSKDSSARPATTQPAVINSQTKPSFQQDEGDAIQEDDHGAPRDRDKKDRVITKVMRLGRKKDARPWEILSVKQHDGRAKVLRSFIQAAMDAHPAYSSNSKARDAFNTIKAAALKMGIAQEDIEVMDSWDGKPRDGQTIRKGQWVGQPDKMEVDEHQAPLDGIPEHRREFYQSQYKKADAAVKRFLQGQADARAEVESINEAIQQYNEGELLGDEHRGDGVIDLRWLQSHADVVRSSDRKVFQDPDDPELQQRLERALEESRNFNEERGYPSDWEPELSSAHPSSESLPPKEAAGTSQTDGQNSSTPTFQWPHPTGKAANEKRILAYRVHGRGHRCVVEVDEGCPVYALQSGSETGLPQVAEFVKMPDAMRLSNADAYKDWSAKDRGDYKGLKAVAIAEYKTHQAGKSLRQPETRCFIQSEKHGFVELPKSALERVLGKESANQAIRSFCQKYHKKPPSERKPQVVLVKKDAAGTTQSADAAVGGAASRSDAKVKVDPEMHAEVDALRSEVDALRSEVKDKDAKLDDLGAKLDALTRMVAMMLEQQGGKASSKSSNESLFVDP